MNITLRRFVATLYALNLMISPAMGEPASEGIESVTDIRAEGDDIVIQLSQLMPYDAYLLEAPWRLVVEVQQAQYAVGFKVKNVNTALVSRIRGYQFKENPLVSRVILDLKSAVDYKTMANGNQVIVSLRKNSVLEAESKKPSTQAAKFTPRKSAVKGDLLNSLPKEIVTLDFEGADIKDVIRLMSETSGINIIFGPEVAGNISVHVKQVPFDEAFRTILNLKGLVANQLGNNILRVTTPELLARERAKAVTFTKSIPINYLKAADMQTHLQNIISSAGRKGTITVVTESNSLVLTDTEEGIQQAEILIAQLDKRPKQVMIESRIVEINLNNGFDIGVQWEYYKTDSSADGFNFLGTGRLSDTLEPTGARIPWKVGTNADDEDLFSGANTPNAAGTGVNLPGPTSAAITFGFVKNNNILATTLAALVTQSKAKILSSPKVVTVNGQEAKIQAVQDIPFRTSTVSGTGVVSNSFTTVSAGIILTVTPTVNAENRITLKIKPESSFPTQDSTEAGPVIRSRNAQTTVIVKDGDTLVIGGLIDDQDTKGVTKVPLLGDIPIIGAFFRSNTNRKIRNELLVFVTPRVIRD
jgi:type IV pilus assembly protein PilQ